MGWDKLNEVLGSSLPISTVSEANTQIRETVKQQGGEVIDVSYSRGTLTSSNSTAEQVRNGEAIAAIRSVLLHGGDNQNSSSSKDYGHCSSDFSIPFILVVELTDGISLFGVVALSW